MGGHPENNNYTPLAVNNSAKIKTYWLKGIIDYFQISITVLKVLAVLCLFCLGV